MADMESELRPLSEKEANRWTALSMKSVLTPIEAAEYASLDHRNEIALQKDAAEWASGETAEQKARQEAAADRYAALLQTVQETKKAANGVKWQMDQWKDAHPIRSLLHRLNLVTAGPLVEIEKRQEAAAQARYALMEDNEGRRALWSRQAEAVERRRELERQERDRQRQETHAQRPQKSPQKTLGKGKESGRDFTI